MIAEEDLLILGISLQQWCLGRDYDHQLIPRKCFNWKSCCFLCSQTAERKYSTVFQVRTLPLFNTLLKQCESRDDQWGREVYGRLSACNDLVAEEAVYHISCMKKFRLNINTGNKRGHPTDNSMMENFKKICSLVRERC